MEVADETQAPASRSRLWIAATVLVVLIAAGVAFALRHRSVGSTTQTQSRRPALDTHLVPDPFATGPQLASWVAAVREPRDSLARARVALDRITTSMQASGAHLVVDTDGTGGIPRARPLDAIGAALTSRDGRVTTLDLARLETGVLRAAGADASMAEQTRSLRPDEPADPTGLLGRYAVVVGDHAVDVAAGTIVSSRDIGPRAIDDASVAGAMLAQSALADVLDGRDRSAAVVLADQAVQQWPDGAVPLATRARVNQVLGGPGAAAIARQDLDAALALRDEAPVHLLRARDALVAGRAETTIAEVQNALRRAPHWGEAALAFAIVAPHVPDAGDRCSALASARDEWAADAVLICHGDATASAAAERLAGITRDPIRLAFAAAAGATAASSRVLAADRTELAAWLLLLGRADLASQLLAAPDAGR
jgi:hypothetical protein